MEVPLHHPSRSAVNYQHPWTPAAKALERVFGRFAFPAPIRILVIFQVMVAVLNHLSGGIYLQWLTLDWNKILTGEVWRIITFLFVGGSVGRGFWLVMIIFYMMIMWMINDGLEEAWGAFRLNLYLFGTWLGLVIASLFMPPGLGGYESLVLYSSLFSAFACLHPNYEILFMFILPVKMKWLAILNGLWLFTKLFAAGGPLAILGLALGIGSFLIVFVPQAIHHLVHRSQSAARRSRFEKAQERPGHAFHVCSNCGVTDADRPDLDFRVGDDEKDYCANCLAKSD